MRPMLSIAAVVAVSTVLSACNSTESLYASGPWAPGVVRPVPGYGGPLISPRPYDLDTAQDIEPGVYPRPVAPGRIEIDVPAAPPPPPYADPVYGAPPPVSVAPLADAPLPAAPVPSQQASLPPAAAVISAPSTRPSSYAGAWKAVDAQGASCRVQLSSAPALDLYKASSSGCANSKLSTVNAWSLRDGSVILFSRGSVVARLSGPEASLSGSFTSGGGLTMTR